jgi:peptidoglycan-associated lipoprotein
VLFVERYGAIYETGATSVIEVARNLKPLGRLQPGGPYGKKLDNSSPNREDMRSQLYIFGQKMHYLPNQLTSARELNRTILYFLFALILASCALEEPKPKLFVAPPSLDNPAMTAAHSPSAMEAISRGVAAVTPPGAALKDVYYEFDSVELANEAQETLRKNADWMKANPKARVEVEGHCDDIGSNEYNLALGAKRAQVAKDFLANQGIATDRLVTISYGKEAPACFEHTEECRIKNRRARFVMFREVPTS